LDLSDVKTRLAVTEARNATVQRELKDEKQRVLVLEKKMTDLNTTTVRLSKEIDELREDADKILVGQVSYDWMNRFAQKYSLLGNRRCVPSFNWLEKQMKRGDAMSKQALLAFRAFDDQLDGELEYVLETLTQSRRAPAHPTHVKSDQELKSIAAAKYPASEHPGMADSIHALIDWQS
jgi:hypothetical protein